MEYFTEPNRKNIDNQSKKCFTKGNAGKTIFEVCDNEIWKGRIEPEDVSNENKLNSFGTKNTLDLRSIRQMLTSQDMMVKTLDNVDSSRRTHCAIKEIDEDRIAVDIVSTI